LKELSYGNGLTETRGFDSRYFPTGIDLSGASTLLDWNILETDGVGNLVEIDETGDATPERSFAYQPSQYFLTCAAGPWSPAGSDCVTGTPTGSPLQWTYDRSGNRLAEMRRVRTSDKTFSATASDRDRESRGSGHGREESARSSTDRRSVAPDR